MKLSELQGVRFSNMTETTKLAFSINLYNIMIRHAFIKVGVAQSSINRASFYSTVSYNVGIVLYTTTSFDQRRHLVFLCVAQPSFKKTYFRLYK